MPAYKVKNVGINIKGGELKKSASVKNNIAYWKYANVNFTRYYVGVSD